MGDNDIFVNSMTRAYSGFLQSRLAGANAKGVLAFGIRWRHWIKAGMQMLCPQRI